MISFKNRQELVDFVEKAVNHESLAAEEIVDGLIHEMQEAGEITAFGLQAEKHLKAASVASQTLGETEGTAIIAALTGIGYALMNNGENAEMFYAMSFAQETDGAG